MRTYKGQDFVDPFGPAPRLRGLELGSLSLAAALCSTADRDWMADASCAGMDPDLFYPERGRATAPAKAVCRACPVRDECADYALHTHERHGIWGGLSEKQRRRLRREANAA